MQLILQKFGFLEEKTVLFGSIVNIVANLVVLW